MPQRVCRVCRNKRTRQWLKENDYYATHEVDFWAGQLRRKLGISAFDYQVKLKAQGNACAICKMPAGSDTRRLHADHDHKTGRFRGILCSRCNTAIGLFKDEPALLLNAVTYLRNEL